MSATARAREGISGFDGLRAVAALTVLTYHVGIASGVTRSGWLAPVGWELKAGVAIFFVISGALLYLPYARGLRDGSGAPDWRRYARRRAVRILPAYWLALSVTAIGPFHAGVFGSYGWRYYGLSQIYASQTLFGGLGVAWSLCVEVTFYLALPLFAMFVARLASGRRCGGAAWVQLILIGALGLGSLSLRAAVAGSLSAPTQGATLMVALPGLLDWFAIGMSLAVLRAALEASGVSSGVIAALVRRPGRCVLLALAVFAAAVPTQRGDTFLPWYGLVTHLAIGLASGLLVASVIVPRPALARRRVLCHPLLAWLGTISYGIYLWHLLVLQLLAPHLLPSGPSGSLAGALITWLVVVAGAVICGAASWYLVERPLQRFCAGRRGGRQPGHMAEMAAPVHSTLDPLNSAGVAADHLA
ncbi:MAG: acyltransferase [Solirubrobacterales bacterium]|nr:acyltransferase [Solirubrobacterales bacterium]